MSPELETLDQLDGGSMPLLVIRALYSSVDHFRRGMTALLSQGDVRWVEAGKTIRPWRWGATLAGDLDCRVELTDAGTRKVS